MTNSKSTKRALLASVLSIAICLTMLIGSTFAWFTDSVSVSGNKIVSGKLDIKLYKIEPQDSYANENEWVWENITDSKAPAFDYANWEPGYVQAVNLRIENAGTLAAKIKVNLVATAELSALADVIDVYMSYGPFVKTERGNWIKENQKLGTLREVIEGGMGLNIPSTAEDVILPQEVAGIRDGMSECYACFAFKMQETAGNEYQEMELGTFDIRVLATQATVEEDSFDEQYDKDAEYIKPMSDISNLLKLFNDAAVGTEDVVIDLTEDFDGTNWTAIDSQGYSGVKNVTINGNGHTIYNMHSPLLTGSFAGDGTVTINDLNIEGANMTLAKIGNLGVGAFVCYSDASGGITLNNCHLKNSYIECTNGYAGGLIGYSSSPITVSNCSVINSSVIGGNSSGAICGQFANPATVSDCKVENTAVSYANGDEVDSDSWRVGVIVGTANVGTVTMTDITESGNTLKQGSKTAPDHSNLYGRSLGEGITLNGNSI